LDEAWNLIDNVIFASQLADFLSRMKQKNCVVIFTSSDQEAISSSDTIFEIKKFIANEIYTANGNPDQFYKNILELRQEEIDIIKAMEDDERHFIFKRGNETIIASLNLKNYPEIVKILSADEISNTAAQEVISANKDESGKIAPTEVWVPQLFSILQEIQRDQEEQQKQALIASIQAERKRKEALELSA